MRDQSEEGHAGALLGIVVLERAFSVMVLSSLSRSQKGWSSTTLLMATVAKPGFLLMWLFVNQNCAHCISQAYLQLSLFAFMKRVCTFMYNVKCNYSDDLNKCFKQ
ncbi:hypothetical protein MHYP_G00339710, partial [Metynnis hypsauchen]